MRNENITSRQVIEYLDSLYKPLTPQLGELRKLAEADFVPIILKDTERFLDVMLRIIIPKRILEFGTAIGYSSLIFSEYLKEGGKIITVELDSDTASIARENFKKAKNTSIKLIVGDGADVLLNTNEQFDVVFLDANKSLYLH